jgi:hypothetical protein
VKAARRAAYRAHCWPTAVYMIGATAFGVVAGLTVGVML